MQTSKVEKKLKKTIANIPGIIKKDVMEAVQGTTDQYLKSVKSTAQGVEDTVKASPWQYMAGVAALAFVAGYGFSRVQGKKKLLFNGIAKVAVWYPIVTSTIELLRGKTNEKNIRTHRT